MDPDDRYHLTRLIDWIVNLPAGSQQQVWIQLHAYSQERNMAFLSYPEQIGFDKGEVKGLLQGIEVSLEVKFGAEGSKLLPALQQANLATLQRFLQALRSGSKLDELQLLLSNSNAS